MEETSPLYPSITDHLARHGVPAAIQTAELQDSFVGYAADLWAIAIRRESPRQVRTVTLFDGSVLTVNECDLLFGSRRSIH